MFLKNVLNALCKTLTMRLTVYYVGIFFCVSLIVYVSFYFVLMEMLEKNITEELVSETQEMITLYESQGQEGLKEEFLRESESKGIDNAFFALASPENEIILSTDLEMWLKTDFMKDVGEKIMREDKLVFRKNIPHQAYGVKIVAKKAADGHSIIIGYSLKDEHLLLMVYLKIFGIALCIIMISVGSIGCILTKRAIGGIKQLTQTAEDIQKGDLKQLVPLQKKGKEIDGLIIAFNNMIERIERLVSELREVTDNIAHDLRSPITRIRGFVETTLRGEPDIDEYQTMAGVVIEECDTLISLINTMLEIAEIDSGINTMEKNRLI
ncbi:MAG: HAMP domain-containing histidine kinase [Candidatus Omnitrophica bacterium]|nr:HAMP domain-containing histidine kinase [Candidatus Omnitrophota bacterium]